MDMDIDSVKIKTSLIMMKEYIMNVWALIYNNTNFQMERSFWDTKRKKIFLVGQNIQEKNKSEKFILENEHPTHPENSSRRRHLSISM